MREHTTLRDVRYFCNSFPAQALAWSGIGTLPLVRMDLQ